MGLWSARGGARLLVLGHALLMIVALTGCGLSEPSRPESETGSKSKAENDKKPTKPSESTSPKPAPYSAEKIRGWIRGGVLPEAPAHGDVFLTMANALWRSGPHDIVIFGDSMAQQGIDPSTLSELAEDRRVRDVKVFNAASSRARWGVNRMLARYAERHDVLPKVAVLVITTRAAEEDKFYTEEVRTKPFSSVTEGCSGMSGAQKADCVRERKDLRFRFRGREDLMRHAATGDPWPKSMKVRTVTRLRSDGYLIHPTATVSEVKKDSMRRLDRSSPGMPQVDESARKAFRDTVEVFRRNGTEVVAISQPYSPVHQANLEKHHEGYDERRREAAAELAASADVPFFQVTSFGSWWGDGDSRDAIHLALPGAREFTKQLWQMPGFADVVAKNG